MSLCDVSPPEGAKFTDRAGAERPRDIEEPAEKRAVRRATSAHTPLMKKMDRAAIHQMTGKSCRKGDIVKAKEKDGGREYQEEMRRRRRRRRGEMPTQRSEESTGDI